VDILIELRTMRESYKSHYKKTGDVQSQGLWIGLDEAIQIVKKTKETPDCLPLVDAAYELGKNDGTLRDLEEFKREYVTDRERDD